MPDSLTPSGDSREAREWAEKVAAEWQKGCRASFVQLLAERLDAYHAHRSAADRQRIAELERDIEDFIAFRDHCHQLGMRWHNVPDGWRDWATLVNRRADSDESELEKLRGLLRDGVREMNSTARTTWTNQVRRALSGEERDSQENENG